MSELLSQEEMTPDKNHHYFALDGNYGVADGMVVVDCETGEMIVKPLTCPF